MVMRLVAGHTLAEYASVPVENFGASTPSLSSRPRRSATVAGAMRVASSPYVRVVVPFSARTRTVMGFAPSSRSIWNPSLSSSASVSRRSAASRNSIVACGSLVRASMVRRFESPRTEVLNRATSSPNAGLSGCGPTESARSFGFVPAGRLIRTVGVVPYRKWCPALPHRRLS